MTTDLYIPGHEPAGRATRPRAAFAGKDSFSGSTIYRPSSVLQAPGWHTKGMILWSSGFADDLNFCVSDFVNRIFASLELP